MRGGNGSEVVTWAMLRKGIGETKARGCIVRNHLDTEKKREGQMKWGHEKPYGNNMDWEAILTSTRVGSEAEMKTMAELVAIEHGKRNRKQKLGEGLGIEVDC